MGDLKTVPGKIKSFVLDSLSEPSDEGRIVKGWASKPVIDRGREKVLTEAFTKTMPKFMENPIMLYMHSMMTPIGIWTDYKLSNEGLFVKGEIVEGVPQADYVWTLVKRRVLRSLSIGFMELDGEFNKADNAYIIKDLELYETSIVSIPMNQDALITLDSGGKFLNIQPIDIKGSNDPSNASNDIFGIPSTVRIFIPGTPPKESPSQEDPDMTPEQEQRLNDAVAATEALKAQVDALQTKVATQETQLAESNTKVVSIETKLDDAQICLTEMVQLFENAEDEESADENHPEQ